jgi:hypothetical protein
MRAREGENNPTRESGLAKHDKFDIIYIIRHYST